MPKKNVGYTDDYFKECVYLFLDQRIADEAVCKQKNFMRSYLRKPKRLDVKIVARRLKGMSYKIPLLRCLDSKLLDDHKLMDILVRMCPKTWRIKYFESSASQLEVPTLDSTVKYCNTLENTSDLFQAPKPEGKRPRNGQVKTTENKIKEVICQEKVLPELQGCRSSRVALFEPQNKGLQ